MLFLPEMGMLVPERSSVPSVRFKGSLLTEHHQISEGFVDIHRLQVYMSASPVKTPAGCPDSARLSVNVSVSVDHLL